MTERRKEGRKEGDLFLSFRDKFAYFWRRPLSLSLSPFSSDYDCDVTKDERRLFFPAFYFIAVDGQHGSGCGKQPEERR